MKPLAIDLYCGLGGWAEGFLAEGWSVIGFDIEQRPYPGELVLQDVTTLDGWQFRDAAIIVASPPCQSYSYRAMPWKRAKALPPPDNTLFEACFRIQREASTAAGRHIPLVVENVRGAQPWVGRAKANFGSYYLWGDVAMAGNRIVPGIGRPEFGVAGLPNPGRGAKFNPDGTAHPQGSWFKVADSKERGSRGMKQPGRNFHFPEKYGIPSPSFHGADHEPSVRAAEAIKNSGGSWFNIAHNTESGTGGNPVHKSAERGLKIGGKDGKEYGGDFGWDKSVMQQGNSRSSARKHASALIAKIPFPLARYIAREFKPRGAERAEVAGTEG